MARSLEFSDKVAELADRVIHGMTMAGKYEYNAVHLRIEKDARDWSQIMGGEEVRLPAGQRCFPCCTSGLLYLRSLLEHVELHCSVFHVCFTIANKSNWCVFGCRGSEHVQCLLQVVWNGYVTSMLQAGFTSNLVLYAASGLLTYGANDGKHC